MSTQLQVIDSNPADGLRLVPHNIEAEQALLGAILINNEAFYRASDLLNPEHFYDPLHGEIYEICSTLIRAGKLATPVTIKTFMAEDLTVGDISITQYLARLASEATTILNAADYGRTIFELATRRSLIEVGQNIVSDAYNMPADMTPSDQIEHAEGELYNLSESNRYGKGFVSFENALVEAVDMAAKAYQRDGGLSGIATNLSDVDRMMGGLQRSDLIILAARPAMGKTALATNIAFHVANMWSAKENPDGSVETGNGGIVGFFSLEMSSEQLATRILAEQSEISSSAIRRGNIQSNQFNRLVDVSKRMSEIPLYIDDTGGLTIAQLAARARRLKRQKGLDLLIVDYLQLLSGSKRSDSRVQELTEITTQMKSLAKELNVPIIALSQLSRQVEARDDKRPQLADLRESGSIEQDADVVLFLYRDEYYLKNKKPKEGTEEFLKWMSEMEELAGRSEVIIGKQRHGPTGTIEVHFDAEVTRFSNLAKDEYVPERIG